MTRGVRWVLVAAALVAGLVSVAAGHWVWRNRQIADPKFDASVAKPAYPAPGPRVCIDQAHHNFATASGRYRPFAELLRNDGYTVTANQARFTPEALAACDVLVIANALGARWPFLPGAAGPAFTPAEIGQVVAWVEGGGALLLI
ncbi:MAG TPA: hypothetical protein VD793_07700, partial [Gemmatimonadales bacterium]|nr:hypothetical protein [Gemmatimonadales bacterium]